MSTEAMTEIERINVLLPTELFAGSKDWRVGSIADRIDWLLTMYSSAKEEVERLQSALEAQPQQEPSGWQKIECPICGDMAIATDIPAAQPQQEPVASLYDDGTWIAKKTEAGRALNDRLLFAGSPAIDVYTRPQAQPQDFSDAYQGAREDLAIWKKRALEAEELNRKFIADINGQTFMGEPAQQEPVAEVLRSWKLNHAQQESEGNPGMWEVGHLNEDDVFSPVITINTGLYYQDADAEPMARAVLAAITSPPARKPLTDEQIDAAIKAWFENEIVAGRQPFAKRMRAAIKAAHNIKEKP